MILRNRSSSLFDGVNLLKLSDDLKDYASKNFSALFDLRPKNIGSVQVIEDGKYVEKEIFRYFKSYLKQVELDRNTGKSYMFGANSPQDNYIDMPELFAPFNTDLKCNQCTINWYRKGIDFIQPHGDCTKKWSGDNVYVINLMRNENLISHLDIYNKSKGRTLFSIPMVHGAVISMNKQFQEDFRHGVKQPPCDRISITLRDVV